MDSVPERLSALRLLLKENGLTHYLIPSSDEHINEYLPSWRQRREWLSGFSGSAGDLLVGLSDRETWLFADGRYHLQAERQLKDTGIGLQKVGHPDGKPLLSVLAELAASQGDHFVLGYDPAVLPVAVSEAYRTRVEKGAGEYRAVETNLVDVIWATKSAPPETPLISCPPEWTGSTVEEKVELVRSDLIASGATATAVVRLDQIAWLTNLRSLDDIPFNPVFESFLFLDADSLHLFLHAPEKRIPTDSLDGVKGLHLHPYREFLPFLSSLTDVAISIDPDRTTASVVQTLTNANSVRVVRGMSPIESRKAEKNDAELAAMHHANLMASVAKTRALIWLQDMAASKKTVTEASFRETLEGYYQETDGYRGLSFATISSTGEHGAIIHYADADDTPLVDGELFLIDSGIQMDGGTTDDTRTVAVGTITEEQRRCYTAVLKGHVRSARQTFPDGTSGAAIDAITRSALWEEGLSYDHGTGHGVGAFLNVHEGPFAIAEGSRRIHSSLPLKPGMVTSIEPGYYKRGFGGIRIENLYAVRSENPADSTRAWLSFEPLTWIPMDLRLISPDLLDDADRKWLSQYHHECRKRLDPFLSEKERQALVKMTGGD